jgi:germination protein M
MRRIFLLLSIILLASLGACSETGVSGGAASPYVSVYRVIAPQYQTDGTLVYAERLHIEPGEDPLEKALEMFRAMPLDERLTRALPAGVEIQSARQDGRRAVIDMSAAYLELTGFSKTLADYCIALTICSIPHIDYVSIYVNGSLIVPRLTADDVLLRNTVLSPNSAEVRLYFTKADGQRYLGAEYRAINLGGGSPERLLMEELLKGPESGRLTASLPEGTVLLSVYTADGVCSVSFSGAFLAGRGRKPRLCASRRLLRRKLADGPGGYKQRPDTHRRPNRGQHSGL